ncbi:MAG: methionine synthase [Tannerellaceae bacterium]|nr:methionine synthase [Tannerellaceae bacterium]
MIEGLRELLKERIVVLDGAMGSLIQGMRPRVDTPVNDYLSVTHPHVIHDIHRQYILAGADIISTNSFNANPLSLAEYGLSGEAYGINEASAKTARRAVQYFEERIPRRTAYVAGSMGPTSKSGSISPSVEDPSERDVTFKELYEGYRVQAEGLVAGGIDLFLIETCFDTLNAKAAVLGALDARKGCGREVPVMVSVSLTEQGRMLSGQSLGAFMASLSQYDLFSVGLNCGFGAGEMLKYVEELNGLSGVYTSAHPNAGLPNHLGEYDHGAEKMSEALRPYVEGRLVNILGGCCGTTPEHIGAIRKLVEERGRGGVREPRKREGGVKPLVVSGLEGLVIEGGEKVGRLTVVGERCNVSGSRRFLRYIKEGKYEEAVETARAQVEGGADMIDVNFDDPLLDAKKEMRHFLRLLGSEPDISRVPLMIDSSDFGVIEAALEEVQGKCIVNSISLKEGHEVFIKQALRIKELGGAVVVIAFDERGQGDTYGRKIAICARAYNLLVSINFPAEDIIFDPCVLAIGTGVEGDREYGMDFIRATRWIKTHLPGAKVSAGVSNLSFAFRGSRYVREALHAVFLEHAVEAGLDMGIIDPGGLVEVEKMEGEVYDWAEDLLLNENAEEALEKLLGIAAGHSGERVGEEKGERLPSTLQEALVMGREMNLGELLKRALGEYGNPLEIVSGPLMEGMNAVGERFASGEMYLPQVIKTARTMKRAVELLQPSIEAYKAAHPEEAGAGGRGGVTTVLFATVKGDVHDIGKNIVSIILRCNNIEVVDLGVMVPSERIIEEALRIRPQFIALSGLISPSLSEMAGVVKASQEAGLDVPILVGGAAASKVYTALKLDPIYDHPVVYVRDAAQAPGVVKKLMDPAQKQEYVSGLYEEYHQLREKQREGRENLIPLKLARENGYKVEWGNYKPQQGVPSSPYNMEIPIPTLLPYINWKYFFHTWKVKPETAEAQEIKHEAIALIHALVDTPPAGRRKKKDPNGIKVPEGGARVCARYGFYGANSRGDDTIVTDEGVILPMLRQQEACGEEGCRSLADYVLPLESRRRDVIGLFAIAVHLNSGGEVRDSIFLQSVTDRLVEAASEYLHFKLLPEYPRGIRPAVGYPSLPDQSMIFVVNEALDFSSLGISLTENGAMTPASSVCGLYIQHPEADYFMIKEIDRQQFDHYGRMRKLSDEELYRYIGPICQFKL